MKKQFLQSAKVIILGLILAVGASYAVGASWSLPASLPAGGNVPAPINEGPLNQLKAGGLGILMGNFSVSQPPVFEVKQANLQATPPVPNLITIGDISGNTKVSLYGAGANGVSLNHTNATPQDLCITSIGQVVLCPVPVNGVCGSASGQPATNTAQGTSMPAPTTNLCSTGTATSVISDPSGHDGWVWTCVGIAGGTTASCGSNKNTIGTPGFQLYTPGSTSGTLGTSHPTTFTVPANVHSVTVEAWGGGGSGGYGGHGSTLCWGGGGGGGGHSPRMTSTVSVSPGQIISVSVGTGGPLSSPFGAGTDGGATTFGSVIAAGGTYGVHGGDAGSSNGSNGPGGYIGGVTGTSGDCYGSNKGAGQGGAGGSDTYGSGGSGGSGTGNSASFNYGAKGSDGAVKVTWVSY